MAEVLPASFAKRWILEGQAVTPRGLLPARVRIALLLTLALLTLGGVSTGLLAWWQPLRSPGVLVIGSAPPEALSVERALAIGQDGAALVHAFSLKPRIVIEELAPTRLELQHCLTTLRVAKQRDCVILYVAAAAGQNADGQIVLFSSDAGPERADAALPLSSLMDAIEDCQAQSTLVLLDLSPADRMLLTVLPASDLPKKIEAELEKSKLSRAKVVTACSPHEQSHLLPLGARTLFGWLAEQAVHGSADGASDRVYDGRVTSHDVIEYLRSRLSPLALRTNGHAQNIGVFGDGQAFELSIASAAMPSVPKVGEYPAWLHGGWQKFQKLNACLDEATYEAAYTSLRKAEVSLMDDPSKEELAALQKEVEHWQAGLPANADSPGSSDEPWASCILALADYLRQRSDLLENTPPPQQKAALQKLKAEFVKAHGDTPAEYIALSAATVASQATHSKLETWQAIDDLIASLPKPPQHELLALLKKLIDLRSASSDDQALADASTMALQVGVETIAGACEAQTWALLRSLWDRVLDERTHGEVLLLARGYASVDEAKVALTNAYANARQLRQATAAVAGATSALARGRRLLRDHVYLAERDAALTLTWSQGVEALAELDAKLKSTSQSFASLSELRDFVNEINRARFAVETSAVLLQERLSVSEGASAAAASGRSDADMHDLRRAQQLLRSPSLDADMRRQLWLATAPLALRLVHSREPITVTRDAVADASASLIDAHRRRMHQAWQSFSRADDVAGATGDEAIALWWQDWQRFRQAEISRASAPAEASVWSLTTVDVLGPFTCDSLDASTPRATFELLWQQRGNDPAPLLVTASSPGDALSVQVEDPAPKVGTPARFRLRLQNAGRGFTGYSGFMAVLSTSGKRYHAPISLPNVSDHAPVKILISASPTELRVIDRISLVGKQPSIYVWLENLTSQPQQLVANVTGLAASAPVTLAPHEVKCISLPAPQSAAPISEIRVAIQEVATQRVVAERTLPLIAPAAAEVMNVTSARLIGEASSRCQLKVRVEAADTNIDNVNVTLAVPNTSTSTPTLRGGRMMGPLLNGSALELSVRLDGLLAGQPFQCQLHVEGLRDPMLLVGDTPLEGSATALRRESAPSISLLGSGVSQPVADYLLAVTPSNTPAQAKLIVSLHKAGEAESIALLTHRRDAQPPVQATLTATSTPGGILLQPLTGPADEVFDVRGLVGRFVWRAQLVDASGKEIATAQQPVTLDDSAPDACRFVRPASTLPKGTLQNFQVAGWDTLTEITDVQIFVGRMLDGKVPPTAKKYAATRSAADQSVWSAGVLMPNELGPCEVTAVITNAAGLATAISTTINIVDAVPAALGEVRGVVLEGTLAQANLEVSLEKTPGAAMAKVKTDAQGGFVFSGVAPGNYTVSAAKATSERKGKASVKVEAGNTANATIKLSL